MIFFRRLGSTVVLWSLVLGALLAGRNPFGEGLFLGVLENLFGAYVSTQWKDALAFVVLVGVLLIRPTGLLGSDSQAAVEVGSSLGLAF